MRALKKTDTMRCGLLSKEIFRIALPAIVSNVTVPLLGMVDVAIVGHMGASYIGAIAVGGLVLNIIQCRILDIRFSPRRYKWTDSTGTGREQQREG